MNWLSRNAEAVEAAAAVATALVALAALFGVGFQLWAADELSREQSARDAYRSHLALAVSHPEFAQPKDSCALATGPNAGGYIAFVDHLLYSAEQKLGVAEGWDNTFLDALEPHANVLCTWRSTIDATPELETMLTRFRAEACASAPPCQ